MVRERYQSNIEKSSGFGNGNGIGGGRRRRPSSCDEVGLSAITGGGERGGQQAGGAGGKPRLRSRFESMVNLSGGALSSSASDLLAARESVVSSDGGLSVLSANGASGSGSRKRLIVREDGKPPTQYVSLNLKLKALFIHSF
jgi:hypothetical protein